MPILFYPQEDELTTSTIDQKLEVLLESAQRYKAIVLDNSQKQESVSSTDKKRASPRDLTYAYNWEEVAKVLREIRELPESSPSSRLDKSSKLKKLAEIYEVLRAAKMPKLEAVRIALMNESKQLGAGGPQASG